MNISEILNEIAKVFSCWNESALQLELEKKTIEQLNTRKNTNNNKRRHNKLGNEWSSKCK